MTVMLMTSSLDVMLACCFSMGLLTAQRVMVGYVYLVEMLPVKSATITVTSWFMFEGLVCAFAPFYFWKISKNWVTLLYCGYSICIMSIVCTMILPESPKLLIELGRLDEAKKSLERIAKLNGKALQWDASEFQKPKKIEQAYPSHTGPEMEEI